MVSEMVTNPIIMPILLSIGIAGILLELFIPKYGAFAIVGIISFFLYFFGHYTAGFSDWGAITLFLVGMILIILEVFIPGGIIGGLGAILLIVGIVMAAEKTFYGIVSVSIALGINSVLLFFLLKYIGHRGWWNRLILKEEQKKESGYVSHNKDKNLLGKTGYTLTKLRPSGIAMIERIRYDVVSQGEFVEADKEIKVILIEGTRIVVEER